MILPVGHQLSICKSIHSDPESKPYKKRIHWASVTHIWKAGPCFQNASTPLSPLVLLAGSSQTSLTFGKCCGVGSVGWMVYRQEHALFCFTGWLLPGHEGNTGLASGRTFLEETASSVCRYSFKFQTLAFKTHICSGICIEIDENRNGFPLYLCY